MADGVPRGTVTSLSSVFPVEEARKAAKRVQDTIADRRKEVEHLQRFVSENNTLLKLVQKLPDELSHEIMVPFGKVAFFPGRLIHTNEFLVLLGDGYYTERTSKQTSEILHRRGKVLESELESLKTVMLDLQAEASFFDATAAEAAEGVIEIREDYVEEQFVERKSESGLSKSNSPRSSETDGRKLAAEDEEYTRIMSRLDELEKEEQEASGDDDDNDFKSSFTSSGDQLQDPIQRFMDESLFSTTASRPSSGNSSQASLTEKFTKSNSDPFQVSKVNLVAKDESSHGKNLSESSILKSNVTEKPSPLSKSKDSDDYAARIEKVPSVYQPKIEKGSDDKIVDLTSKIGTDRRKAFTGSIVEHSHGMPSKPTSESSVSSQVSSSNPSRPVSRFKMQKGGR